MCITLHFYNLARLIYLQETSVLPPSKLQQGAYSACKFLCKRLCSLLQFNASLFVEMMKLLNGLNQCSGNHSYRTWYAAVIVCFLNFWSGCHPKYTEVIHSILHSNISHVGHLYALFFNASLFPGTTDLKESCVEPFRRQWCSDWMHLFCIE